MIRLTAFGLIGLGAFALLLSVTEQFLPHDLKYLGMTPAQLCAIRDCRIVHFMFHNRISLGGSVIGVGILWLWLDLFPLARGEPWAWWLLLASGVVGFGSFLTFLGHGYVDTWHAVAVGVLFPLFMLGLARSPVQRAGIGSLLRASAPWSIGRACLLATAFGLFAAGITIMLCGMTVVFVPQDLGYLGMSGEEINAINPRLVPLISHDRAGFGGGVCACGLTMFFCTWCGTPSRALWRALFWSGLFGFATAIGVHPVIGYLDFIHLAPAVLGAVIFAAGLALSFGPMARTA